MSPFFKDSWNQLFILTLGTSAIFLLSQVDVDSPQRAMSSAVAPSTQSPREPQALPPQKSMLPSQMANSSNQNLQNQKPRVYGEGFVKALKPHKAGEWVVDIKKGEGSDSDSLAEAMFNASEGDIITIRPGVYREAISFTKDVQIVGQNRDDVILENLGQAKNIFNIDAKRVALSNLTLRYSGTRGGFCAICAEDSQLTVDNVNFQVQRNSGLKYLINMSYMKSADIKNLAIADFDSAIRVADSLSADIKISNSSFSDLKIGIALDTAKAVLQSVKFTRISNNAVTVHDGELTVDDMKVSESQTGIFVTNSQCNFANIEMERMSRNGIFLGDPGFGARKLEMKNITIRQTTRPWSIMDRQKYLISISNVLPYPANPER